MKVNRNIPFGYCVTDGKYELLPQESEVVKRIFDEYIGGKSLKDIAAETKIPYNQSKPIWNKNMVKRVLENRRFLGESGFPAIIPKHQFEEAARIKDERNCRKWSVSADILAIREKTVCKCGGRIIRFGGNTRTDIWRCESECAESKRIDDKTLKQVLHRIFRTALNNTAMTEQPDITAAYEPTDEILLLTKEIARMSDIPNVDKQAVKELILRCADMKYSQCQYNENAHRTDELKQIFSRMSTAEPDISLFSQAVNQITIGSESVSVTFINGATVTERRETNADSGM